MSFAADDIAAIVRDHRALQGPSSSAFHLQVADKRKLPDWHMRRRPRWRIVRPYRASFAPVQAPVTRDMSF